MNLNLAQKFLKDWYSKNKRSLPWRENKDPYLIWVSEVMLQQTTVQAVIPYFLRFRTRFPTVESLAKADLEAVYELWAGLGYYSRARNLHRAAQKLAALPSFPRTSAELLELPGFGDYTARAVSSIAFNEPVGVVDGNVIRILSRLMGKHFLWWTTQDRRQLQTLADRLCMGEEASVINQAMMELGAMVCTPKTPSCTLCPWLKLCEARKKELIDQLPAKRPKKEILLIGLDLELLFFQKEIALTKNHSLPFLKGTLMPPLKMTVLASKPSQYDFQHSITNHQIFVRTRTKVLRHRNSSWDWHSLDDLQKINPSSLIKKALHSSRENSPRHIPCKTSRIKR